MMLGCILAAIGVAMGAFGAHGLVDWLKENHPDEMEKRLEFWNTAARYQIYHSIGIVLIGLIATQIGFAQSRNAIAIRPGAFFRIAGLAMLLGILLFSGCLYLIATTTWKLGMIVPLGGVGFILGWVLLAIGIGKAKTS